MTVGGIGTMYKRTFFLVDNSAFIVLTMDSFKENPNMIKEICNSIKDGISIKKTYHIFFNYDDIVRGQYHRLFFEVISRIGEVITKFKKEHPKSSNPPKIIFHILTNDSSWNWNKWKNRAISILYIDLCEFLFLNPKKIHIESCRWFDTAINRKKFLSIHKSNYSCHNVRSSNIIVDIHTR